MDENQLPDTIIEGEELTKPTGWLCPRCSVVNAPHVDRCDCMEDKRPAVGPSEVK